MENQQFKQLERKVSDLIQLCEQMDRENRVLKSAAIGWQQEREQLIIVFFIVFRIGKTNADRA